MAVAYTTNGTKTILVVGEGTGKSQKDFFAYIEKETPYRFVFTSTGKQALTQAQQLKPDLLFLNQAPSDMPAIELYDRFHQQNRGRNIPALFITSNLPGEIMEHRNIVCLGQPFQPQHLITTLDTLVTFPYSTVLAS